MSYIRRDVEYLVMGDKPGNNAPGRFYKKIRKKYGDEVRFIQLSFYGAETVKSAKKPAELANHHGLNLPVVSCY